MISFMPTDDMHDAYQRARPAARTARHLVFRDPAMAAVVSRAERAARSDASVMISGASGTGK